MVYGRIRLCPSTSAVVLLPARACAVVLSLLLTWCLRGAYLSSRVKDQVIFDRESPGFGSCPAACARIWSNIAMPRAAAADSRSASMATYARRRAQDRPAHLRRCTRGQGPGGRAAGLYRCATVNDLLDRFLAEYVGAYAQGPGGKADRGGIGGPEGRGGGVEARHIIA